MPLIIAGIDEAGYGPLLGPLCIGMAAFRVDGWKPGDSSPNLWSALAAAVCRRPGDKKRRIAVDDSKKLKLPNLDENEAGGRHPLLHLERAVLSFLAASGDNAARPATDLDLLRTVGAAAEPLPWYAGEPAPIPCTGTAAEIGISANLLARAMHRAGVAPLRLACRTVCEGAFNDELDRTGTKAAATMLGVADHLRFAWDHWAAIDPAEAIEADLAAHGEGGPPRGAGPRIVCDRQGGRISYRGVLSQVLPGTEVLELEETERCSRYLVRSGPDGDGRAPAGRTMTITFMPEAERQHLPVALASMLAKLVRELMMARFNTYWRGLIPELKPTAGYVQDGRRWLADLDAAGVLTPQLRRTMVRRA